MREAPFERMPTPSVAPEPVRFGTSRDYSMLVKENEYLRQAVAELEELNKRDSLTGLHNRQAYNIMLQSEYGKVKTGELGSLGVVRIDLDNFSWVNDVLGGHHFGDVYLAVTSNLLNKHIRKVEDTAFRVGGDEFALLLTDVGLSEEAFADSLTRTHELVNGKALKGTLSVLKQSHRMIKLPGGKTEREGTVALKELLTGMMDLRDNADNARGHFIDHGRGSVRSKQELLTMLDKEDFSVYADYHADIRTESELTDLEIAERKSIEERFAQTVIRLFPQLTISMAGVLVSPQTELDPLEVDKKADMMVGMLKRRGGSVANVSLA